MVNGQFKGRIPEICNNILENKSVGFITLLSDLVVLLYLITFRYFLLIIL